ncbi:hypothetical protein [Arenibacter echinorum]|uniref:Type I phosphodiesterase/nucleotide pyrophosphatase n=1 Tax=Arenibacter echinorum TaxID=440515 RepID=A0A327QUQ9_9FLAO|nr:hypothetical protein [Arenibacter echinorum]RAJ07133.1 hypothetical protein LV92_04035 [Arenibacter echinorum]
MKKVILLGLNEINFDYIKYYINEGQLSNFKKLFEKSGYRETTSEKEYKNLEPWIQWVTIYTGKTFDEHQVFRLGDIVNRKDLMQIFEKIESNGYTVGAVSPFNADNRLKKPLFFAPDPWTQTKASGNKTFTKLSLAISQAVNDNANGKLTVKSIKALIKGLLKYTSLIDYGWYIIKLAKLKSQTGIKAQILDKLLADAFLYEWKKNPPDFSNLFLNSGAHFQHHYMFNSRAYKGDLKNPEWYCPQQEDPLFEILKVYDIVLGHLLELNVRLIIATGLHQQPHKHLTYYWRIKDHAGFLEIIGIKDYTKVIPKMSRDFLVEFSSVDKAKTAEKIITTFKACLDNKDIFTIDNRGKSLFIELTYPANISDNFSIEGTLKIDNFRKYIAFVAIKNGEHNGIGYVLDTANKIPSSKFPLNKLHTYLLDEFKVKK